MSWRRMGVWVCDKCQAEETTHDSEYDLEPEGWVHTMAGDDLCERCYGRTL